RTGGPRPALRNPERLDDDRARRDEAFEAAARGSRVSSDVHTTRDVGRLRARLAGPRGSHPTPGRRGDPSPEQWRYGRLRRRDGVDGFGLSILARDHDPG